MINVEIKARCTEDQFQMIRESLNGNEIYRKGFDRQIDTYFKVPNGRLKLRSGDIENFLIQYDRPNQAGPKISKYLLVKTEPGSYMREALTKALGVLVVVDKLREIFYLDNIKIQLDRIEGLGTFVEIEARDENEVIGQDKLQLQCELLMDKFGIKQTDLIESSYSDMILEQEA